MNKSLIERQRASFDPSPLTPRRLSWHAFKDGLHSYERGEPCLPPSKGYYSYEIGRLYGAWTRRKC